MSVRTSKKANQLGLEKLASSGLTASDAKALGMQFLSAEQTAKLYTSFKPLCSIRIDYFDHLGKPMPDRPGSSLFYRLRYLEMPTDFATVTGEKPLRYVQEPETAPVAYFPKIIEWAKIVNDVSQPLILTEGEFKAAKACKEGFPTIGLGGVYNWRARKMGIEFLPSLEIVQWSKRHTYICFDSDYRTNKMVCNALHELAKELHRRGAFVHLVSLPQIPDIEKTGLDDYLVNTKNASDHFLHLLEEAEPLGLTAPLWNLNEQYIYVRNPGLIVDRHDFDNKIAPGAFKEHVESTQNYQERSLKADGTISFKTVAASAAWLKWPLRTTAAKLTYAPGKELFVEEQGHTCLNIWTGWGCEPKKGNVKLFLQLIDHLFIGADPGAKEWFLKWLAYPLQHPGTKMFSSAVVHGIHHGTGKSLIGYTMQKIYGRNFTEISELDLHNQYNEWAEGIQFAMGDDVTGSDRRHEMNFLKKIITQLELRLNPKYVRSYRVPDRINYYFTANGPDSFFLEDRDRRFFITEVTAGPLPEAFYKQYEREILRGSGASAIFNYLLALDTKTFNPAAPAFSTSAKDRMINNTQSDLATWVRTLIMNPEHILKLGEMSLDRDLYTSKELKDLYDPLSNSKITANGIGRELARAGVRQVMNGKPIRLPDGSQNRYFAVRNADKWMNIDNKYIIKHLIGEEKKKGKKY